ncbi:MAG TPA: sigma-70 family RNA polymerase sigma factor [Candidatus Acidoferrales bacterium]|nr:sigma-70 family RNA polymerase sigma factor [Candidatus Acidoferrales bacterium]
MRKQTPPESIGRGVRPAMAADGHPEQEKEQEQKREQELIERIKRGEKELFHDLIRPHERRVYLTALAILRNEADAEDTAQDAILKAFKHLSQFRQESRFSTWLLRVTINEARMRQRKEHRDIMKPLVEEETEESGYTPQDFTDWREIPSEALERKEVRELLARALASLAQKYREVFMLRDVHQVSIEQAAEIIGISPGAVKTRLLRARLMLRDLLAPGLTGAVQSGSQVLKGSKPWS